MGLRRRLFLLQALTLGIVTAGALGGWGLSHWVTAANRRESALVTERRDHLAHISFDLVGTLPQTGRYLLTPAAELATLIEGDIARLDRFREGIDGHLTGMSLNLSDRDLTRELEALRLLAVQLERRLLGLQRELRQALQTGRPLAPAALERTVSDPSLVQIREHGQALADQHNRLDQRLATLQSQQTQALQLGLLSWSGLLLLAWVLGLTLSWRTADRLLAPLVRLEALMKAPSDQVLTELEEPLFRRAPAEILSLSQSFRALLEQVNALLAQLEDQLRTDGLTAIGNRRHFDAMLQQEWRRAQRSGEPLSLLLVDVDHFKLYNDTYGHSQGDRCLQQVAAALRAKARRSSDVVCRIGGEEFALLLPRTHLGDATELAQTLAGRIRGLAIPHAGSPVADRVTVSIGVASCLPPLSDQPSVLMDQADGALYERKKRLGRNGVCVAGAGEPAPPVALPLDVPN